MTSLMQRLFITLWVTLFLAVVATAGLVVWRVQTAVTQAAPMSSIERGAATALAQGGRIGLQDWLADTVASRSLARVFVVDADGYDLLGRPLPKRLQSLMGTASINLEGVVYRSGDRFPRLEDTSGATYRLLTFPPPGSPVAAALQPWPIAVLAFSLLALTAFVSALVARQLGQPLADLKAAIDQDDIAQRGRHLPLALAQRHDEIGALARSYAAFSQRLGSVASNQQKLFRDLSHELRAPIARMRLALELDARQPEQAARLSRDIGHLETLIGPIIELNRLHSEAGKMRLERADLLNLIDTIAVDAQFEAEQLGKSLVWAPDDSPVHLDADPFWLSIAIENVVRNAIHAGPAAEAVEIELEADKQMATLHIKDSGPGVPSAQLEDIFSPFNRNAGTTGDGFGVGLAIAARIITLHKGSVYARNRPTGGLTVSIEIPLAQA